MVVFHRHDDYVGYYDDLCATRALLLPTATTKSQTTITKKKKIIKTKQATNKQHQESEK